MTRAFMANRGGWEPTDIHSPSISFAHTERAVETNLDGLGALLHRLLDS